MGYSRRKMERTSTKRAEAKLDDLNTSHTNEIAALQKPLDLAEKNASLVLAESGTNLEHIQLCQKFLMI